MSKWIDKWLKSGFPKSYRHGYVDGFKQGLLYSKKSFDDLNKAVLLSPRVLKESEEAGMLGEAKCTCDRGGKR